MACAAVVMCYNRVTSSSCCVADAGAAAGSMVHSNVSLVVAAKKVAVARTVIVSKYPFF